MANLPLFEQAIWPRSATGYVIYKSTHQSNSNDKNRDMWHYLSRYEAFQT